MHPQLLLLPPLQLLQHQHQQQGKISPAKITLEVEKEVVAVVALLVRPEMAMRSPAQMARVTLSPLMVVVAEDVVVPGAETVNIVRSPFVP